MDIAYLILAHDRPDLASRLSGSLDGEVYVHVDARVDASPFHQCGVMVEPRVEPRWGSWGIVEATLNGMKTAARKPFDRLMLLSGRDYPVKPPSVIAAEMSRAGSVIDHHPFPHPDWRGGGWNRVTRWNSPGGPSRHVARRVARNAVAAGTTVIRGRRRPPMHPYGGSAWWCMTSEAVEAVLDYCQGTPDGLEFWRRVEFPDEIFFQTVLAATGLPMVNRAPTLMAWHRPGGIVQPEDLRRAVESNHWFARKFDDVSTMDLVDGVLGAEAPSSRD